MSTTTISEALRALHAARTPHFSDPGGPQLYAVIGTAEDLGALTDAADQLEALSGIARHDPAADDVDAMLSTALGEPEAARVIDEAIAKACAPVLPAARPEPRPVTAPEVLEEAAGHILARAGTYDRPAGERSAGAAAAALNAITGRTGERAITEPEAWLFLQCLKQVRLFAAPGYHSDSAEDNCAYGALLAEAKAREAEGLRRWREADAMLVTTEELVRRGFVSEDAVRRLQEGGAA